MSPARPLDRLLDTGDLDGLLRAVDEACDDGDWDSVEAVAERARGAHERGHQLWPAADHADHRLALAGPADAAARAVGRDAQRFGLAPLAEVAASGRSWADLEPHLPDGPLRALVAHERVTRGEDLTGLVLPDDPLDLPLRLAAWEPATDGPAIGPYDIDDPAPPTGRLDPVDLPSAGPAVDDPAVDALRDLTRTWTEQSEGTSRAVAVTGDAPAAVAALGATTARMRPIGADEAMTHLAWAAASGGAHGRRPGTARGRFDAWWCAHLLAGFDDDWPPDPGELGDAVLELAWWSWDDGSPVPGWHLGLAVADPDDGLAWALDTRDHRAAG